MNSQKINEPTTGCESLNCNGYWLQYQKTHIFVTTFDFIRMNINDARP